MKTFPQLIFGYHGCELDVEICVRNPEVVVAYFLPR